MTTTIHDLPLRRRRRRRTRGLVFLLVLLVALLPVSVAVGTLTIPIDVTWDAIISFNPDSPAHLLVRHNRIPRTLLAILVGGALGVAGLIMQALTRNPLADPGILGINAGAAVAVAAAISVFGITGAAGYMWFGLAGAVLAGIAVYLLGGVRRGTDPIQLVLSGTALSIVLLAITQILIINSPDEVYNLFRAWVAGSIQGRGYETLWPVGALVFAGLVVAAALPRALDVAALGEDLGKSLGVSTSRVWVLSAASVVLLAGGATAGAGPLIFVGLAAPHLARAITGPDHRWATPYAFLVAADLVLLADILGRTLAPPGEVGVGIMVAMLGGPFFVLLVRRRRLAQL